MSSADIFLVWDTRANTIKFLNYIMYFSPFSFQLMIDLSLSTPIQDASVYQFPLDLVSQLLQEVRKTRNPDDFLGKAVSVNDIQRQKYLDFMFVV